MFSARKKKSSACAEVSNFKFVRIEIFSKLSLMKAHIICKIRNCFVNIKYFRSGLYIPRNILCRFFKISERIILKLLILSNETLIGHTLFQYQGGFLIQTLDIRKNPERFLRFVKFKLIFLFKNCLNSVWDSDAKYTNGYLT